MGAVEDIIDKIDEILKKTLREKTCLVIIIGLKEVFFIVSLSYSLIFQTQAV
jgi:hypothetical protein